jgi:hypothetical protein
MYVCNKVPQLMTRSDCESSCSFRLQCKHHAKTLDLCSVGPGAPIRTSMQVGLVDWDEPSI